MKTEQQVESALRIPGDDSGPCFSEEQAELLLALAEGSIARRLGFSRPHPPHLGDYPSDLRLPRAVFVTLELENRLRGCIGTLEAVRPLVFNVAKYAILAAISDPRFPPLSREEFPCVQILISILSQLQPMRYVSEQDLIDQLRPGVDGLILEDGPYRGTLLPCAWEGATQDKFQYLQQLKRKAGLQPNYWSGSLRIHRYTTCCIR